MPLFLFNVGDTLIRHNNIINIHDWLGQLKLHFRSTVPAVIKTKKKMNKTRHQSITVSKRIRVVYQQNVYVRTHRRAVTRSYMSSLIFAPTHPLGGSWGISRIGRGGRLMMLLPFVRSYRFFCFSTRLFSKSEINSAKINIWSDKQHRGWHS